MKFVERENERAIGVRRTVTVMTHILRTLFLIGFLYCSASAQKVKVEYDKEADFSQFKSYAWSQGTPAPGKNMDLYITHAIDQEMQGKGLSRVENVADADLVITYHVAGDSNVNVSLFADPTYIMIGGSPVPGTTVWATGYPITATTRVVRKGMLAVELFDRKRHGLLWIGTAKATLEETQNKRLDQLDRSLVKMFAQYPPKKK